MTNKMPLRFTILHFEHLFLIDGPTLMLQLLVTKVLQLIRSFDYTRSCYFRLGSAPSPSVVRIMGPFSVTATVCS